MTALTTTNNNKDLVIVPGQTRINTHSLPVLGILRKGAPKTESNKPGRELPYFRIDWRPEYAHLHKPFVEMYGENPFSISNVHFMDDEPFSAFYEKWGGNVCLVRHNGEVYERRFTDEGFDYTPDPVRPEHLSLKPTGRLTFFLPDFSMHTMSFGVFMVLTTSKIDCKSIADFLGLTISAFNAGGIPIVKVPFKIFRYEKGLNRAIRNKETGKMVPSRIIKHMVGVMVDDEKAKRELAAHNQESSLDHITNELIESEELPALESGEPETPAIVTDTGEKFEHLGAMLTYASREHGINKDEFVRRTGSQDLAALCSSNTIAQIEELLGVSVIAEATDDTATQPPLTGIPDEPTPKHWEMEG